MCPLSKTPFLFPLLALITGILVQYYGQNIIWSMIALLVGGVIILLSYLLKLEKQFTYRWAFGLGVFFSFLAVGGFRTSLKQESLTYKLSDTYQTYVGYVIDTPQEKPHSLACKVHLEKDDINIVCYLEKDSTRRYPEVGDQIIFVGELQAFKNSGNPDGFDYQKYMYNQGMTASVYLPNVMWKLTGEQSHSLFTQALRVRQRIMELFTQMGFSVDEQAILSALTLGYQNALSEDLKQGFRTTGTVHVLSVSGLHVGIIYGLITFLLSFLPLHNRHSWIKSALVILLLWSYAFVTGLPPSVVRASVMLTAFCAAEIFNRRGNSLNNLFVAAFAMLLYNPFQFFDIGFQLSCLSVLSILVLYPILFDKFKSRYKSVNIVVGLLAVSFAAQLATFPLCLYYFGTFPTYFFLTNIFIVVLVSLIIYGVVLVSLLGGLSVYFSLSDVWLWLPIELLKGIVQVMTGLISLFEKMPYALIDQVKVSFVELVLIYAIILTMLIALRRLSSKAMIVSLSFSVLLLVIFLVVKMKDHQEKYLMVLNNNKETEVVIKTDGEKYSLDVSDKSVENPVYCLGKIRILLVNDILALDRMSDDIYDVNYAIVADQRIRSANLLHDKYKIDTLIVDGVLKSYVRRQLTKECENRKIHIYDVTKKGAYRINF